MKSLTHSFQTKTHGKGTYPLNQEVESIIQKSGVNSGIATVFVAHTSASLVLYENADPTARQDLHDFFEELVPENGNYVHTLEGPDDATSHLRMALTRSSEVIPIKNAALCLGTWQGLYLFEHRHAPHYRTVYVNVLGT